MTRWPIDAWHWKRGPIRLFAQILGSPQAMSVVIRVGRWSFGVNTNGRSGEHWNASVDLRRDKEHR